MAQWALPINKCLLQEGSNHVTCFSQGKVICRKDPDNSFWYLRVLVTGQKRKPHEKKTAFEPVTSKWIECAYQLLLFDQQWTWEAGVYVETGKHSVSPETQNSFPE